MAAGRQDGRRAGRPVGRLGGRGCATAGPCAPAGGVQRGTGVVGAEGGSGRGVTSKERELGRSLSSYVGAGGEGAGVNDKRSARRCRWVLQGVRSGDRPRRLDTQPTGGGCTDSLNTEPQRGVIPPGKERWAGRGGDRERSSWRGPAGALAEGLGLIFAGTVDLVGPHRGPMAMHRCVPNTVLYCVYSTCRAVRGPEWGTSRAQTRTLKKVIKSPAN